MQTLQKMKLLGMWCWGISDTESNSIQKFPQGGSMDGGTDGITYNTDADGDPKLFNVNRNDSEPWLNNNNGHMDNRWNANNRFVFRSSILFRFSSKIWMSFILHSRAILSAARSNRQAFFRFRELALTG